MGGKAEQEVTGGEDTSEKKRGGGYFAGTVPETKAGEET